jgi:heme exporter protein D
MSLGDFLHMGGYGLYVWSSYALALVILLVNLIQAVRRHRSLLRDLARRTGGAA